MQGVAIFKLSHHFLFSSISLYHGVGRKKHSSKGGRMRCRVIGFCMMDSDKGGLLVKGGWTAGRQYLYICKVTNRMKRVLTRCVL